MNSKTKMFGLAIPVWAVIGGIIASGSMAIAVQPVSNEKIHIQDTTGKIQTNVPVAASRAFSPLAVEWSDDQSESITATTSATDGFVVSAGAPATTSLTVTSPVLLSSGGGTLGSTIQTKQKMVMNLVLGPSEDSLIGLRLDNNSEDTQVVLVKAGTSPNVLIDFRTPSLVATTATIPALSTSASASNELGTVSITGVAGDAATYTPNTSDAVTVQGLTGHNEWLVTVPSLSATSSTGIGKVLIMEVSTTDAGFYPIVVELERVG